jgi:hypothetical protein
LRSRFEKSKVLCKFVLGGGEEWKRKNDIQRWRGEADVLCDQTPEWRACYAEN